MVVILATRAGQYTSRMKQERAIALLFHPIGRDTL